MHADKPFSAACERNREPILGLLRIAFARRQRVLEIGSGSGQHAVHFAAHLAHLVWQPSDRPDYLPGLRAWCEEAGLANLQPPLQLDVLQGGWPEHGEFDAGFMANTLHIMSWPMVDACFRRLDAALAGDATLVIYGPFRRDGRHTSESNAQFDADLRQRDPAMGVRDLQAVTKLAVAIGFAEPRIHAMPANNFGLVFERQRDSGPSLRAGMGSG
jgi:hypothetical protein